MKVADVMSREVQSCRLSDSLERAAQIMWDHDRGALPVLDEGGHTVAMITDRDTCMAAYTRGKPLRDLNVYGAASARVHTVRADEPIEAAVTLMVTHRVRRLPVLDLGGNLVGVISLADLARHSKRPTVPGEPLGYPQIAAAVAEVYRPCAVRGHPLKAS